MSAGVVTLARLNRDRRRSRRNAPVATQPDKAQAVLAVEPPEREMVEVAPNQFVNRRTLDRLRGGAE